MNSFTLPLSDKFGLPVTYINSLPALIDTGAVIPVFSIYPHLLELAFDVKLLYENKFISGFGGREDGSIYEVQNFSIGKLNFKHLEVFVPDQPRLKYPLLLSATLFFNTKYEIDAINNALTISTNDDDDLKRDFRIKDLKGELYPQINGVLLEMPSLYLQTFSVSL